MQLSISKMIRDLFTPLLTREGLGAVFLFLVSIFYFLVSRLPPQSPLSRGEDMGEVMTKPVKGTILIVEDETELRFILVENLRAAGYHVLEQSDGQQCIDCAIQHLPDVIIMDVGLPVMDGIAATRALKANEKTACIPVIMLTAHVGSEDVIRGLEAGAQEYLPKPFDISELIARVRSVHRMSNMRKDMDRINTHLEAEVDLKTSRLRYLYDYMRDLNLADSRDRILDLIISCVSQTTGATRISLFVLDEKKYSLICERSVGLESSMVQPIPITEMGEITRKVFQSGKMLAVNTYGGLKNNDRQYASDSFVSTPIIKTSLQTHDGIIGVLNATEKKDGTSFQEDEIQCVQSIADAAAIALDNLVRRQRLEQSVRVLLNTVGHLAEYRDEETAHHIERVSVFARVLAEELQREGPYASEMTDDIIEMLVQAAPLHDIGKVGIADDILTKPGKLTNEEFTIMKMHTEIGRRVLSQALDKDHQVPLLQMCIDIVYGHHEKWNGEGYPQRISGEQNPLSARIISLVDAYDAMCSRRRYKSAISHEDAVIQIKEESGKHFDPILVEAFLRCQERFESVKMNRTEEDKPLVLAMASV